MINEYSIDGEVATIILDKGYCAKVFVCDFPLISKFNWRVVVQKRSIYALAKERISIGVFKTVYMHRVILGAQKGVQVDHKDGDGLNNLYSNLRLVNSSQNAMNMRRHSNKHGLKGANFNKKKNKWCSQISVSGNIIYLGCFETESEAHAAYCIASKKYHGEFGRSS